MHRRLKESELSVSVERACEIAKKTERELFHLYKDTDNKYKNKYRSLMFNLKDTKNNVSFNPDQARCEVRICFLHALFSFRCSSRKFSKGKFLPVTSFG